MPRDGSGIYTKPYPNVVSGTTIESAVHNGTVSDIETDLNAVRPIIAGGTGASNADQALVNMSGEKAAQLVTNYDSQLWMPGSFRSAAAATGAPNATSSFVGTAYINETLANPPTNQNVVLEARDQNDTTVPGRTYVREKKAGVWSAWTGGIYAASFDALAYNGMQINGSMEVSQENGTSINTLGGTLKYIVDGIGALGLGAGGGFNAQQVAITSLPGFPFCVQMNCTAPTTNGTAGNAQYLYQPIEGYRWSRLMFGGANAQPVTIGFWINSPTTGNMAVSIRNATIARSYVADVSISVANVWQYKTITIPGDVLGTWGTSSGIGGLITFCFGGASDLKTTANTWMAGNFVATSSTTNFFATAIPIYFSGVIIIPGTQAPTAAQSPNIMRPYDQELVVCKRYWEKIQYARGLIAVTSSQVNGTFSFELEKRAAPTAAVLGNLQITDDISADHSQTTGQITIIGVTTRGMRASLANFVGAMTTGRHYNLYTAGAQTQCITVDARL